MSDVLELSGRVLPGIHEEHGHFAWMLEVGHIVDFVVDQEPEGVL